MNIERHWLTWFIGFIEGDGAILTTNKNTRLRFVLTQKEREVLDHIKSVLGFGQIHYYPQSKNHGFYRFMVEVNKSLIILAYLFNENLAINNRIDQLYKWITIINDKWDKNIIFLIHLLGYLYKMLD